MAEVNMWKESMIIFHNSNPTTCTTKVDGLLRGNCDVASRNATVGVNGKDFAHHDIVVGLSVYDSYTHS